MLGLRTLEKLLLELSLGDLNLDSLVDLLLVASLVVGIVLDGGGEESVDEGGLAQARLASNLSDSGLALCTLSRGKKLHGEGINAP